MFLASAYAGIALNSFSVMWNDSTLSIYSGVPPGTAEAALSGNTLLVQYTFSNPAFGLVSTAGGFVTQTASFVSSAVSPTNTGTATFGRVDVVSTTWAATTNYVRGHLVSKGGNYYKCLVSGTSGSTGPTATGLGQLDATTAWDYVCPTSAGTVIAQLSVGTSGTDIIMASTAVTVGVTATITAANLQIPVN